MHLVLGLFWVRFSRDLGTVTLPAHLRNLGSTCNDASLVSASVASAAELDVDGPLRGVVLDQFLRPFCFVYA